MDLPAQPLVSIIVPVYNTDPRWLRAAIESVRRQAYTRWELCICDDASTSPETREVLGEYESDPRIRIAFAAQNRGISAASNAALALARGELVALLDHDDELAPDALAEVVKHVNAHPDADVIYSDEDKLDLRGERCDPYFKPDWSPEHFLATMYTCHLMVIRRDVLADVGGFRTGYEGAQDYDLLLRIMDRTSKIHHIPRILYHWRKHAQSTASVAQAKPWALDAGRRGARRLRAPKQRRWRGAGRRGARTLPRPPPDPEAAARLDRHSHRRPAARGGGNAGRPARAGNRERRAADDLRLLRVHRGRRRRGCAADDRACARGHAGTSCCASIGRGRSTSRQRSTPARPRHRASTSSSSTTTSR